VTDPVTIVTGTSRGIGRELALRRLAAGGAVVGCSRGAPTLEHDRYVHVEADVTDERTPRALLSAARKRFGGVDHVLNNAGIASMNHAVLTPTATVRRILEVNVVATFAMSREAAKAMQRSGGGRIVNFTTVAVPLALEGEAAYVASKAAVEALTRVLARELAPFSITVNAVGPTPIATDLVAGVPEEALAALVARQPLARMGTIDDVAHVVDFFLDPRSSFVTGQVLYLGGVS
jgi:3-oxoacyl-[acyl-carrier protein] reductase